MHKNFRRQQRGEGHLGETVRIASIVQKGIATGRSSYVEMNALDRLTNHNITTKVKAIKKFAKTNAELQELLTKLPQEMSGGYTNVLTPNGIVRDNELDQLLSLDADIVTYLGMIEKEKIRDVIDTLKDLVGERKKLVDSLKA
jgi:hypothetical protein